MRHKIAIAISIIFHLCLLYVLSGKGGGDGDDQGGTKGGSNRVSLKIQEKKQKEEIKDQKPMDGKILVKHIKKKKKKIKEPIDCKDFYIGIGVETSSWSSCRVTKVFAGYPAEANGILAGDLVISPSCYDIVGPEGSTIDMVIMRGSKVLHLSFKRGKICGTK